MRVPFSKYEYQLLITPVVLWIIFRFAGLDGTTGQDSYAYTTFAVSLQEWLHTGIKPNAFFWPPGYPLLAALLSLGILPASIILQFVSSISLGVSLVYLKYLLTELNPDIKNDKSVFIYLVIWGMFAPYVFRNSLTNTSDMLAFCMVSGTLYHYFMYLKRSSFIDLIFATVFISYGIFTRYVTILVFFPFAIHMIWHWIKTSHSLKQTMVLLIPISILGLHLYLTDVHNGLVSHPFLTHWKLSHFYHSRFSTPEGQLDYLLPNILFVLYPVFHPGFCMPGILFIINGILKFKKQKYQRFTLIGSYVLFGLFMAGNYVQSPRHLLGIYPIVMVLCFHGFYLFYKWFSPRAFSTYIMIGILILQFLLCARALYPTIKRNRLEKIIATEINSFIADQHHLLYSFDIDIALQYRQPDLHIQSLYDSIIVTYIPQSLVLINEQAWSRQWQDKNPMINVVNLKKNHQLTKLKEYHGGWNLYRIEK